ncbi:response regulator [Wenxinia marina]|uniref:Response regulator n=1 Tax=Wenxinia marina DSM 24838 TaxID=1123501 RepID=A0A0D0NIA3_9RHOB|nr:response regulator [Wenxinia marina]KIQ68055.1 Response regulator [Wenxinia marina DSM 24838]GGL75070.1 response regulator [Wenxinia marina]
MKVLIVENKVELAEIWRRHLAREIEQVDIAASADEAIGRVAATDYAVVVIDLSLAEGDSPISVADYVQYRRPDCRIIYVTDRTFFSDGSIFSITPQLRALVPADSTPEDLAALVEHYGNRS